MHLPLFAITGLLIPLATSVPLNVDIHITDDIHAGASPAIQHVLKSTKDTSPATMVDTATTFNGNHWANNNDPIKSERIPGWIFINGDSIQARIHGNTFWNVKGKLSEKFLIDEYLFDPLIFTLNHPTDFEGSFNGTFGKDQVSLVWEKSGATMSSNRQNGLDQAIEVKGETKIDWSP